MGFLVDDWSGHAGVTLRQRDDGAVIGEISADSTAADPDRVHEQAARILSLDHDGRGYPAVGEREPLIGQLQCAAGWLRPVLFHSPYEADVRVASERRLRAKAAALYGVPDAAEDDDAFLALAERWRPFRTWVSVLVRSAG